MGISGVFREVKSKIKGELARIEKMVTECNDDELREEWSKAKEYENTDYFEYLRRVKHVKEMAERCYERERKKLIERYEKLKKVLVAENIDTDLEKYLYVEDIKDFDLAMVRQKLNDIERKIIEVIEEKERMLKKIGVILDVKIPSIDLRGDVVEKYFAITNVFKNLEGKALKEYRRIMEDIRSNPDLNYLNVKDKINIIEAKASRDILDALVSAYEFSLELKKMVREECAKRMDSMGNLIKLGEKAGCSLQRSKKEYEKLYGKDVVNLKDLIQAEKLLIDELKECFNECVREASVANKDKVLQSWVAKLEEKVINGEYADALELCYHIRDVLRIRMEKMRIIRGINEFGDFLDSNTRKYIEGMLEKLDKTENLKECDQILLKIREHILVKFAEIFDDIDHIVRRLEHIGLRLPEERSKISDLRRELNNMNFSLVSGELKELQKKILNLARNAINENIRVLLIEAGGDARIKKSIEKIRNKIEDLNFKNLLEIIELIEEARDRAYQLNEDIYRKDIEKFERTLNILDEIGVKCHEDLIDVLRHIKIAFMSHDVVAYRRYSVDFKERINRCILQGIKNLGDKIREDIKELNKKEIDVRKYLVEIKKIREKIKTDTMDALDELYGIYSRLEEDLNGVKERTDRLKELVSEVIKLREDGGNVEDLVEILRDMKKAIKRCDFEKFDDLEHRFNEVRESILMKDPKTKIRHEIDVIKEAFKRLKLENKIDWESIERMRDVKILEEKLYELRYSLLRELEERLDSYPNATSEIRRKIGTYITKGEYKSAFELYDEITSEYNEALKRKVILYEKLKGIGNNLNLLKAEGAQVNVAEDKLCLILNENILGIEVPKTNGVYIVNDTYGSAAYVLSKLLKTRGHVISLSSRGWGDYLITELDIENGVNPQDIENKILSLANKHDAILIEDLNYLILKNGYERVLRIIENIKRKADSLIIFISNLELMEYTFKNRLVKVVDEVLETRYNLPFFFGYVHAEDFPEECDVAIVEDETHIASKAEIKISEQEELENILSKIKSQKEIKNLCIAGLNLISREKGINEAYLWLKKLRDILVVRGVHAYISVDNNIDQFLYLFDTLKPDMWSDYLPLNVIDDSLNDIQSVEEDLLKEIRKIAHKKIISYRKIIEEMPNKEILNFYEKIYDLYKREEYFEFLKHASELDKKIDAIKEMKEKSKKIILDLGKYIEFLSFFMDVDDYRNQLKILDEYFDKGNYEKILTSDLPAKINNLIREIKINLEGWYSDATKLLKILRIDTSKIENFERFQDYLANLDGQNIKIVVDKVNETIRTHLFALWKKTVKLLEFAGIDSKIQEENFKLYMDAGKFIDAYMLIDKIMKEHGKEILQFVKNSRDKNMFIIKIYEEHGLDLSKYKKALQSSNKIYDYLDALLSLRAYLSEYVKFEANRLYKTLSERDVSKALFFRNNINEALEENNFLKAIKLIDDAKDYVIKLKIEEKSGELS